MPRPLSNYFNIGNSIRAQMKQGTLCQAEQLSCISHEGAIQEVHANWNHICRMQSLLIENENLARDGDQVHQYSKHFLYLNDHGRKGVMEFVSHLSH